MTPSTTPTSTADADDFAEASAIAGGGLNGAVILWAALLLFVRRRPPLLCASCRPLRGPLQEV